VAWWNRRKRPETTEGAESNRGRMSVFKNPMRLADAVNDYFAYAVYAYLLYDDPVVRLAALTAAKVMAGGQRAASVNWLRVVASEFHSEDASAAYRVNQLADEISLRDWEMRDIVHAKTALAKLDPELEHALPTFDADIFIRRYPQMLEVIRRGDA